MKQPSAGDPLSPRLAYSEEATLDAILRNDFVAFVQKVFATVSPGDAFATNWHIEAVAHALAKVACGETRRLVITMPPRYLKSICASVALPAWILGHDPTRRIICVSYSQDLAVKFANDTRAVMMSDWYRRIFPGTKVDPAKNTESETMTTKRGFRLATSVGGTLTGRGGDLIIIDDPIKPEDAMADRARDRVIDWYGNTLLSRLDDKENGAIVLVMQRLHEDDLAGHLLRQGRWQHLNLPVVADSEQLVEIGPDRHYRRRAGELLHPARQSSSSLEEAKLAMGSAAFNAQYLQAPVPPGGRMIQWDWFQWYDPNDPCKFEFDEIVVSWDTATKASELHDYSVATVWGRWFELYLLLDLVRLQIDYPDLRRKAIELHHQTRMRWGSAITLVEDAGSGSGLVQDLRAEGIGAVPIKPEGDKVVRMAAQTAKIEAGRVYLLQDAPWLDDLKSELLAFPGGAHDDQVDSISQALKWLSRPRTQAFFLAA